DDRFRDNPIVLSSGARFYAGAPLRSDEGRAIGTLCLVDVEPRTIGPQERDLLRLVAEGVMAQVKLQIASRQLLKRTQQMEQDLQQAVQMQRFLLPPERLEGERPPRSPRPWPRPPFTAPHWPSSRRPSS
ncbi:MAG: GAF domain-containing protein, partial [Planctomycetota bacterium]